MQIATNKLRVMKYWLWPQAPFSIWSFVESIILFLFIVNSGEYIQAVCDRTMAENISKVLYPNDNVCVHANIRLSSFARKCIHREGITTHLNDACLYFYSRRLASTAVNTSIGVFFTVDDQIPKRTDRGQCVCMCVGFDITAPKLLAVRSSKFCSEHLWVFAR